VLYKSKERVLKAENEREAKYIYIYIYIYPGERETWKINGRVSRGMVDVMRS
jgi:hypothetical protein